MEEGKGESTVERSDTLSSGFASELADDETCLNVVVRVRPLSQQEQDRSEKMCITFPGGGGIWMDSGMSTKSFTFNVTFEPEATQEDVFEHSGMKKLVDMAVNGYSCTAFAFGQTGSGKTHTITGPPELLFSFQEHRRPNPDMYGLIPRSFHHMFQLIRSHPNAGYRITASYLEIYNEQVIDLLNPTHRRILAVRWSKNRGFYVENLFVIECEGMDDLMAVLEEGLRNRQTGTNSVNEHSSRSHSMLTLHIDSEFADPDDDNLYVTKHGKLTFVDLAGSEKTKTDATMSAHHLAESNNINKSLLVLGNCISALGDSKKRHGHIPYRDSKLTKLLADSLGGSGVTLMIACVSPSMINSGETMNTLRYANRAKKIKSKPVIKMDPREKLILSLKKEIKILRQENHYLRQQLEFPVKPKGQLQKENDAKFLQLLRDQRKDGKQVSDHGLYEMLQEYMIENETLRTENSDLHGLRDQTRREQQMLARENERLLRRIERLEREVDHVLPHTPLSIYNPSSPGSSRDNSAANLNGPWMDNQRIPQPLPAESPRGRTMNGHGQPPRGGGLRQPNQRPPHHLPQPIDQSYEKESPRRGQPGRPPPQRTSRDAGPQRQADQRPVPAPRSRDSVRPEPQPRGTPRPNRQTDSDQEPPPGTADTSASAQEMNDRLRQELLDLEDQIKQEARDEHSQGQRGGQRKGQGDKSQRNGAGNRGGKAFVVANTPR